MRSNYLQAKKIKQFLQSYYTRSTGRLESRKSAWTIFAQYFPILSTKKPKLSTTKNSYHSCPDNIQSSMYNYQTFRREQIVAQHCQSIRRQHLNHQTKRQQSCPSLAHNHKKRVEAFILSAIDKPVPVSQYKNQPPCFRNTTGPTLGSKGFYIRRQSQSQRIEHSMKQNSELDCRPFNNTATHQFRESKGKGLKYKPLTESLRVKDYLDRQELNYLPNSSIKEDKLTRKAMTGQRVNLFNLNKTLHKTLLPVLHAKTYFKSVSTLFTEIPAAQKRPETSVCLNDDTGEEIQGGERRPVKAKDHMSRKQNSRQALVKCNMLSNVLRA